MAKKILGYILSFVGIISIIASIPQFSGFIKLPIQINPDMLLVIGLVVFILGIFILIKGKESRKSKEVPIFHGKEIVGYRRH